jgi:hypothetical protein
MMKKDLTTAVFLIAFIFGSFSAWITHVITCIETQQWLFLIAGAVAAPIGIIHGVGLWLGAW